MFSYNKKKNIATVEIKYESTSYKYKCISTIIVISLCIQSNKYNFFSPTFTNSCYVCKTYTAFDHFHCANEFESIYMIIYTIVYIKINHYI